MKISALIFFFCLFAVGTFSQGVTYYSQGSLAADNLSSWNSLRTGGGTTPTDFVSGDFFVIQNGHSMTTSNVTTWSIQGDNCGFVIESGGAIQVNKGMTIVDINFGNETVTLNANAVFIDNTGTATTIRTLFAKATNKNIDDNSTVRPIKPITFTNNGLSFLFGSLDVQSNINYTSTGVTVTVNGVLNIASGITYDLVTNILGGSPASTGSGLLRTKNGSANPIPSSTVWNFPIEFYSDSTQSIPSGTYYKIINSGNASKGVHNTVGAIDITGFLTISSGTFNIGNNNIVTLKSNSISSTAQVDQVVGSITYTGTGAITVERYIPNGNRAYRDLGSVVYNSAKTIYDNWQEQGANNSGLGIAITGKASNTAGIDPTTGFDKTATGNPSMYSYVNGVWNNVSATNNINLNPYQGYRVFVRGDRTLNLYQNPQPTTMNAATKLRTTGKLITGTVTYNTSGVSNSNYTTNSFGLNTNNTDYSIVANPYQAIINWNTISKTNLSGTYWYYDPTIGSQGAYVTYNGVTNSNGASGVSQYIQPGQAFFVLGNGGGSPVLTIQESDKATNQSLTSVFGGTPTIALNKIAFTLWRTLNNKLSPMDGSTVLFGNNYSNSVKATEDADKFSNSGENLAIYNSNYPLSIDSRLPAAAGDTIQLRFWSPVVNTTYTLRVDTKEFTVSKSVNSYLLDKYTNSLTPLKDKDTLNYSFKATSDSTSYLNRFAIVFVKSNVSALQITPSANINKQDVNITWNAKGEYDLISYNLERSTDSINFTSIQTLAPLNLGESVAIYNWVDNNPAYESKYYYRIKATNIFDNIVSTSAIVSVDFSKLQPQLNVYPNPVKGTTFNLETTYLKPGTYLLEILNQTGNKIVTKSITISNSISSTNQISLDNLLSAGTYIVRISAAGNIVANLRIMKQP